MSYFASIRNTVDNFTTVAIPIFKSQQLLLTREAWSISIFLLVLYFLVAFIYIFFGEGQNCGLTDAQDTVKLFFRFLAAETQWILLIGEYVLSFGNFNVRHR